MNLSWPHLLGFLVAVCLLVTVHEFGHYWVARRLGFKVLRFSVGFGRPLWKRTAGPDQTEYVLAAIPLGGYVKLLDEREGPVPADQLSRAFTRRPHWQRIAVLLAGPAFNFLFAILVLTGMLMVSGITEIKPLIGTVPDGSPAQRAGVHSGDEILSINGRRIAGAEGVVLALIDGVSSGEPVQLEVRGSGGTRKATLQIGSDAERRRLSNPDQLLAGLGLPFAQFAVPPILGSVIADGPGARAGLQAGDRVLAINGEPVNDFREVVERVSAHPGETLSLRIRRDDGERTVPVTAAAETVNGQRVGRIRVGMLPTEQFAPGLVRHIDLGPVAAFGQACDRAWSLTVMQARLLWRMLLGRVSLKNISGPLTIAQMAGETALAGISAFLSFLVLVSLALGFMNLLPIPILDGGQIVIQAIEWLKGSPLSERAQLAGQQLGIMLVVALLGIALFNDIVRQLG